LEFDSKDFPDPNQYTVLLVFFNHSHGVAVTVVFGVGVGVGSLAHIAIPGTSSPL